MRITMKDARINARISQTEIARRLGVTSGAVSQWEKGTSAITARQLERFCEIVGVSIGDIIIPKPLS